MSKPQQPGASAADWAHWQSLGLTADLLPVVSDPTATLSPNSKIGSAAALAKTPSQFNRKGEAVGIPDWPNKETQDRDIARWCRDFRLGICLKTGAINEVCAGDFDIADKAVAQEMLDFISLLYPFPVRYRNNSGKFTILFKLRGRHPKRVLRTAHGSIEFLGTGQQTVVEGTHPSGARYEWLGGQPVDIPELSVAEFTTLWTALAERYALEPETVVRGALATTRVVRAPNASLDDTTNFLEANGWVKSWSNDGRVNIRCPWEHEHTTDTGETSTQYFPAGVGGFERGHFKCLHAHCAGRLDGDFLDAIGVMDGEFEDLTKGGAVAADGTALAVAPAPSVAPPAYARTRAGEVLANSNNLTLALERPDQCGMRIAWDTFKDEIVWASPGDELDWRPFRDADYMELRNHLQRQRSLGGIGFKDIGRELIRDCVHYVATQNRMDSATIWAESLVWDGVPRVERFYSTYFRTDDTLYSRAVGLYTWTALAGRALVPGIKADMAIILKSEQGTVKTEGVKSMAPHEDNFGELDLHKSDDALARQTRGKLVCELSELRGMNSREAEAIKAWVSRRYEEWVPKFKEFATKFPRRFICFGTTNEDEFLADSTGERRWLPLEVGRTDIAALRRDCWQLWAEGVHLFRQGGIQWAEAERLAKFEHGKFKVQDSWESVIAAWLEEDAFGQPEGVRNGDMGVRIAHVLQSALGVSVQNINRKDELRVAKVLRKIGFEKRDIRTKEGIHKWWINPERKGRVFSSVESGHELG